MYEHGVEMTHRPPEIKKVTDDLTAEIAKREYYSQGTARRCVCAFLEIEKAFWYRATVEKPILLPVLICIQLFSIIIIPLPFLSPLWWASAGFAVAILNIFLPCILYAVNPLPFKNTLLRMENR